MLGHPTFYFPVLKTFYVGARQEKLNSKILKIKIMEITSKIPTDRSFKK